MASVECTKMYVELFSAAITAGGLIYAGRQFYLSRQLAKHEFMLKLFEKMDNHNELHEKIQNSRNLPKQWPRTQKDRMQVGRLLGLFEHISSLVEDGVLTLKQVDEAFSYRLAPIIRIQEVREMINAPDSHWDGLNRLICDLEKCPVYKQLIKK